MDLDAAEAQAPDAPGEASRDKKPGRRRAAPLRPSPPLPPSPLPPIPSPLPPAAHQSKVTWKPRSVHQPCEGCQGYYGDVYWGRGISQLAMILLKLFMLPLIGPSVDAKIHPSKKTSTSGDVTAL